MFGFVFCQYFPDYIQDISDEEVLYGGGKGYVAVIRREFSSTEFKIRLFWTNLKNRITAFSTSRWRFVPPLLLVLVASLMIPLDVQCHMFTPNVEFYTDIENVVEPSYFLSIESEGRGYNIEPSVEVTFEKLACDMVKINRGIFDQLDILAVPLPSHCLRSDVVVNHYRSRAYNPTILQVVYPESLKDNVTITPIPVDSDPDKLQIQFMTEDERSFNFTMNYLAITDIDNVYVYSEKVRGEVFNATHDLWIQEFRIINQNDFVIYLQDLSYDMLMFEDVDRDSITLQYNKNVIDYATPVSDLYRNLHLYVGNGQTVTITLSYLSTNKFP